MCIAVLVHKIKLTRRNKGKWNKNRVENVGEKKNLPTTTKRKGMGKREREWDAV